jgi:hypothetical protein
MVENGYANRLTAKGYGESQLVIVDVNQRTNQTVQRSNTKPIEEVSLLLFHAINLIKT